MASDRDIVARHVGRRIRALREAKGIAARTLADHLGIDLEDLTRFEQGEDRIAPNLLVAMARFCAVDVDWFFRDAPPPDLSGSGPDGTSARFMSLAEAPPLMRAFVAIPAREGRLVVVNFARMVASPHA